MPNKACGVAAMTEGNIFGTDKKNSYYRVYCPDMLNTYQRQTKLFDFSQDTDMKWLD